MLAYKPFLTTQTFFRLLRHLTSIPSPREAMGHQLNSFHPASHNICACTRTRACHCSTNLRNLWTTHRVSRLNPTRSTLHDGRRLLSEYLDPLHPSLLRWSYLLPSAFHWSWFKRRRRHDPESSNRLSILHLEPFPRSSIRVSHHSFPSTPPPN
jgi:hypothetical protein